MFIRLLASKECIGTKPRYEAGLAYGSFLSFFAFIVVNVVNGVVGCLLAVFRGNGWIFLCHLAVPWFAIWMESLCPSQHIAHAIAAANGRAGIALDPSILTTSTTAVVRALDLDTVGMDNKL